MVQNCAFCFGGVHGNGQNPFAPQHRGFKCLARRLGKIDLYNSL